MRCVIASLLLLLSACATAPSPAPACSLSAEDAAWTQRALAAWRETSAGITHIRIDQPVDVIFVDSACAISSANALSAAPADVRWTATQHRGEVTLPGGDAAPVCVMSFASVADGRAFFVMTTPSVWRAGGVPPGPLGLETLMVAVLLHEASHVAQAPTYGAAVDALSARYALPEDFSDDSMQHAFGGDAAFAASVQRETELLFAAASATDSAEARRLASEARQMMRARADRAFVGENAYYREAEDLWLTLEGSGQWAGYQWLLRTERVDADAAMAGFGARSRWWSQKQGLAIALTLDRLEPDWTEHAFGGDSQTMLSMLDRALEAP